MRTRHREAGVGEAGGNRHRLREISIRRNRVDEIEQISGQGALLVGIVGTTHFFEMWNSDKASQRLPVARRSIGGQRPELKRPKSRVAETFERIQYGYCGLRVLQRKTLVSQTQHGMEEAVDAGHFDLFSSWGNMAGVSVFTKKDILPSRGRSS